MGIKKIINKIGGAAGDAVAKVSVLSPEQLEKVEDRRNKYLSDIPDSNDPLAVEQTSRLLASVSTEIYNSYLSQIKQLYSPIDNNAEYDEEFDPNHNIRFINITKWVTNKEENSLEKLVTVYDVLSNEDCNIALIFNRTTTVTNVYLAVVNTNNSDSNVDVNGYMDRITSAIKGNFPGSKWKEKVGAGILPCFDNEIPYSVSSASNIPTEKSEKFISQTIEKLLDGVIPKNRKEEYTVILLATPVQDVEERKLRLGELYSALAPYSQWQTNYTFNEMEAFGSSATVGVNVGVSAGSQAGTNQSSGISQGQTDSYNQSQTTSDSSTKGTTETDGEFSSDGINGSISVGPSWLKATGGVSRSEGTNSSTAQSTSQTVAKSVGQTLGKAVSNTASSTIGTFASHSLGGNLGASFARSSSVTATVGKNEGITQSFTNFNIKHTLELLEQQMKRLEQSTALGMWDFAAYVLSEDYNIANNVAHSYIALTQGEESYMSEASINLWRGDMGEESDDAKEICHYLRELRHPIFGLDPNIAEYAPIYYVYPSTITATTTLSGKELAYSLNFPKKSIAGLPVIECAEFGRNVVTYDEEVVGEKLHLGNVYHMHHEENISVDLNRNSLASHTFITGSTGSGKSNTVYQILREAMRKDIGFLVVEPAKGEYKHAFGNRNDVDVYGTNPSLMPLLKINPFSFPKEIHVLEHIDRLVELFNVCWPMYAAMPAVLKNAVEVSYEDCGWDLTTSINPYGDHLYPSFKDICRNIKTIIDTSEYDAENKGAYKGSLLTRLQSLTNGIYGMIFNDNELSSEDLFDKNVIIDLSRVGSTETKSLIMGILVLKLQEYRMTHFSDTNEKLKHLTVLEEAHNLLKRTSTEQSSESANLVGKSVEMISNAIAEMRTYGEGFIIADQAPGLLDMATIRNTNTKIIMRLPDEGDRELVGKAASLNDDQIIELAKLPLGVGAIYQNEWINPVLCKIDKTRISQDQYKYEPTKIQNNGDTYDDRLFIATLLSKGDKLVDELKLKDISLKVMELDIASSTKVSIMKWIKNPPMEPKMTKLAPIMSDLFPEVKNAVKASYNDSSDPREWTLAAQRILNDRINRDIESQVRRDIIQSIITDYIYLDLNNRQAIERWSKEGNLS